MGRDGGGGVAGVSWTPRRGDVYWINLDPVVGTAIRKTRPAVVVSNDSCNRYGTRTAAISRDCRRANV
jgi:mRNA-degrading endonuclease toxin of MazEF toxin-antitoxin module